MNTSVRHFVAEFVGTFALVFIGSGAIIMASRTSSTAGLVTVGLAHGIILAVMVSATMNVSGGHLNPAVTVGVLLARRIGASLAAVNIVAQLAGAVAAGLALKGLMPAEAYAAVRGGGQTIAADVTLMQAISLEAIATFFLVFVVFGTAVNPEAPRLGGMAIGLTIAADIIAIGPLTGASMNPARSFGPAVATGVYEGQIVFWAGPLIGGILAALIWQFVLLKRSAVPAP
jgi:MIP family channel proteins